MKNLELRCLDCGGVLGRTRSVEYPSAITILAVCSTCSQGFEVRVARIASIGTRRRGTGIPQRRGKRRWLK